MATKRSRDGHTKSTKMAVNKWLDLPSDLLSKIFFNLNPIDMLFVVPLVCKYWGQILCKILFFDENKNLLNFKPLWYNETFHLIFYQFEDVNSRAKKLMNLIVGVMHAFSSDGDVGTGAVQTTSITKIVFPVLLPLYDKHLVYIAERCPELKYIDLPCAGRITGKGIARAMRFWTGMKSLSYGPFSEPLIPYTDISARSMRFWTDMKRLTYGPFGEPLRYTDTHLSRIIEEIGINCKNLQFLHLRVFELHWQSADIIVRNLKCLKILCFSGVYIHKCGMKIFLSRCKKLVAVKFAYCYFANSRVRTRTIILKRVQDGRRNRWTTNIYPDEIDKSYTPQELVDRLWMRSD